MAWVVERKGSSVKNKKGFAALMIVCCVASSLVVAGLGTTAGAGEASCFEGDHSRRGQMKGDVDGDGNRDAVWISAIRRSGSCRYFVKADLGSTQDRKRLRGDRFVFRNNSRVMAMVRVDTVPGREFGVVVAQGASTVLAKLFTIRANTIREMDVHGAGAPAGDAWPYGGSVGLSFASDCARRRPAGQVIYSEATINDAGTHYRVKRRWFQVVGVDFERTAEPTDRRRVRAARLHERFYEFSNSPFGSCGGRVRG